MNTIQGFPTIYNGKPEPTGNAWLEQFAITKGLCERGAIVVLCGGNGTGKTRMAYEVAKSGTFPKSEIKVTKGDFSYWEATPAIYTTAMGLFVKFRDAMAGRINKGGTAIMKECAEACLLVIDELQDRGETAFEDQILTAVVDARYQHGRPTILIANLARNDLASRLSPSLISRIRENGGFVDCNWPSYRKNP
jgi:DNA replication protein DnaC